mmetsp:Transcript_1661/g.4519  ORF Transcript_1661/g.4519 Transcript_1661/m.4519 type:complete len:206 (+) Transcript_1661:146-763(+)
MGYEPTDKLGSRNGDLSSFSNEIALFVVSSSNVNTNRKVPFKMLLHKSIHLVFLTVSFTNLRIELIVGLHLSRSNRTRNGVFLSSHHPKYGTRYVKPKLEMSSVLDPSRKYLLVCTDNHCVGSKQMVKHTDAVAATPKAIQRSSQGRTQMSHIRHSCQPVTQSTAGQKLEGRRCVCSVTPRFVPTLCLIQSLNVSCPVQWGNLLN